MNLIVFSCLIWFYTRFNEFIKESKRRKERKNEGKEGREKNSSACVCIEDNVRIFPKDVIYLLYQRPENSQNFVCIENERLKRNVDEISAES